ncbi:NAD(P)/FAD-dependent oxidoreductase [soil metagenome]
MIPSSVDAVVIGAGPNGLVGANVLADEGWKVVVLEANDEPGGAVRTAEVTAPGFRNDLFSAFYPLGAASPVLRNLELDRFGLRWVHAPRVVAHPVVDGPAAVLSRDLDETAESLDQFAAGDGDAWRDVYRRWEKWGTPLLESLLSPFPPVKAGLRMAAAAGLSGALPLARLALLPVRRFAEEEFEGAGGRLLLTGNALHADLTPESSGSGLFWWLLASLGQQVGFPVPEGGAQRIIDALVDRLRSRGGEVVCGARVDRVVVERGRAVGVETGDGRSVGVRRAVLADVDAPTLYTRLVGLEHLPASTARALQRFQRGSATVKIDWALSEPIPWRDPTVGQAGTVHIAESVDELTLTAAHLAMGLVPAEPFLLLGQMTTSDPSRSPAGTESAWTYTHVPSPVKGDAGTPGGSGVTGRWDASDVERFVARMEDRIEAHAPGVRDRILARHLFTPKTLFDANANLMEGDIGGGTAQLHQQVILRPTPGFTTAGTPVAGLYLASASAHPGGGVHGACGNNAARAALAHHRLRHRVLTVAAVGTTLASAAAARRRL